MNSFPAKTFPQDLLPCKQRPGNRGAACLVEGPLNAVEVFEKILQLHDPLEVWTTPASLCPKVDHPRFERPAKLLHRKRDVSFVVLSTRQWDHVLEWMKARGFHFNSHPQLSIPCEDDEVYTWDGGLIPDPEDGPRWHLRGLSAFHLSEIQDKGNVTKEYREKVTAVLNELGLEAHKLTRSKLPKGAEPLPICFDHWVEGIPGRHSLCLCEVKKLDPWNTPQYDN